MEVLRWRWRAVAFVLALALLMFWAMVTFLGPSDPSRPTALASAVNDASSLPSVPLQFPDLSQPLQEQALAPEPVSGDVVTDSQVGSSPTSPPASKASKVAKPTVRTPPVAVAAANPDEDSDDSSDDQPNPVGDFDDGFENPSSFGPADEDPGPQTGTKLYSESTQAAIDRIRQQAESRFTTGTSDAGGDGRDGTSQTANNANSNEGDD